jgi:hypothetical protein
MGHGRIVYFSLYGLYVVSSPFGYPVLRISQVEHVIYRNKNSGLLIMGQCRRWCLISVFRDLSRI